MAFTVILPKGRMFEVSIGLLQLCGLSIDLLKPRSLIFVDSQDLVQVVPIKMMDVLSLAENKTADACIAGSDVYFNRPTIGEHVVVLESISCYMSFAAKPTPSLSEDRMKICTKYQQLIKQLLHHPSYFVMQLTGSVEAALPLDLVDVVCDIVSTGETLATNRLIEVYRLTELKLCWTSSAAISYSAALILTPLERVIKFLCSKTMCSKDD